VNIDFIEPKLPSRRAWILASLPMVLALILWCALIYLRARLDAQREQLAAAELATKAPPTPPTIHRPPPAYQAEALAAIKRAALPEADALAELEHVEVVGIQLRSIDVNPAQGVVVVELDAANDEALGDYLDQLNAGDAPPKWHIQKLAALSNESRSSGAPATAGSQGASGHSVSIARSL
jgi:hypothetical protein